jgi:hypothetical protein
VELGAKLAANSGHDLDGLPDLPLVGDAADVNWMEAGQERDIEPARIARGQHANLRLVTRQFGVYVFQQCVDDGFGCFHVF